MTQDDILGFLNGNAEGTVLVPDRKEAYEHVTRVLRRFSYWRLGKPDKGLLLRYLRRTTGLSRAQLTRLVGRDLAAGELGDGRRGAGKRFRCRYGPEDILLLAETDKLHGTLSGSTTLVLLKRAWEVFGDARFERLAGLSNGHLYNLRRSTSYVRRMGRKEVTRSAQVTLVERRRPRPEGLPGYLRSIRCTKGTWVRSRASITSTWWKRSSQRRASKEPATAQPTGSVSARPKAAAN